MFRRMFLLFILGPLIFSGCAGRQYLIKHTPEVNKEDRSIESERMQIVKEFHEAVKETTEESLDISSLIKITNFEGEGEISSLALSNDGKYLLFQTYAAYGLNKRFKIWSINADTGKGLRYLNEGDSNDLYPCWFPDREKFAFVSDRSGIMKIWVMNQSGIGGLTQLTFSNSYEESPDISPDGGRMAFVSYSFGNPKPHLWTMSIDGANLTELCEGKNPKYSPDGNKILFITERIIKDKKQAQLWLINSNGSYLTHLFNCEADCMDANWSPDGKQIVFSTDRPGKDKKEEGDFNIWLINSDGTGLTQLTGNSSYDGNPVFSRDGKFIYFVSNRGLIWNIWKMKIFQEKDTLPVVVKAVPEEKIKQAEKEKIIPPNPPVKVTAISSFNKIKIYWRPAEWKAEYGYNIYKSRKPGGPYEKINKSPVISASFFDYDIETDIEYYYAVTVVNMNTHSESSNSSEVKAILQKD